MHVNVEVTPQPINGRCAPLSIVAEDLPSMQVHRHDCEDTECTADSGFWAVITVPVTEAEADRLLALGTN